MSNLQALFDLNRLSAMLYASDNNMINFYNANRLAKLDILQHDEIISRMSTQESIEYEWNPNTKHEFSDMVLSEQSISALGAFLGRSKRKVNYSSMDSAQIEADILFNVSLDKKRSSDFIRLKKQI